MVVVVVVVGTSPKLRCDCLADRMYLNKPKAFRREFLENAMRFESSCGGPGFRSFLLDSLFSLAFLSFASLLRDTNSL